VFAEAALVALAGAFYPIAFLLVARYLSQPQGVRRATVFFLGGAFCSVVGGAVVLIALRGSGLSSPRERQPSGVLHAVLGLALVGVGVWAFRHRHVPVEVRSSSRQPTLWAAFLLGALNYFPGLCYLGAVKVIADSEASAAASTLALVVSTFAVMAMCEVPIVAAVVFPKWTASVLDAAAAFVRANSRTIVAMIALVVGAYLIARGIGIALEAT
jgi:hypothetical protein